MLGIVKNDLKQERTQYGVFTSAVKERINFVKTYLIVEPFSPLSKTLARFTLQI